MGVMVEMNHVEIGGRLATPPKAKLSRRGFNVAELSVILRRVRPGRVELTYVLVEFWDRPALKLLNENLPAGTGIHIVGVLGLQVLKTGARLIVLGNTYDVLDIPANWSDIYEPPEAIETDAL